MARPVPPTQDEIDRVAAYWARVKALACTHPEITFNGPHEPPMCGECNRPIFMLSDLQLEERDGEHFATIRTGGPDGARVWQGVCRCGAKGEVGPYQSSAEYWINEHLVQVARARAHRTTRAPGLADQAKWYRQQASVTEVPQEKAQWEALATELEHRIGTPMDEPPLF